MLSGQDMGEDVSFFVRVCDDLRVEKEWRVGLYWFVVFGAIVISREIAKYLPGVIVVDLKSEFFLRRRCAATYTLILDTLVTHKVETQKKIRAPQRGRYAATNTHTCILLIICSSVSKGKIITQALRARTCT